MLKPDENIQQIIISSTSRFVGEYESENFLITHAHAQNATCRASGLGENPYCRNYYVVAFKATQQERAPGVVIPDYSGVGELFCLYLSVLFGKRFDNHGMIQGSGHFYLPNMDMNRPTAFSNIGIHNHLPRKGLEIELNFSEVKRIEKLVCVGEIPEDIANIIMSAARFYLRSIRIFEEEPELAFLDFITCGEILSNYFPYSDEELFDERLLNIFNEIESQLERGGSISSDLKNRLYQVKRKYSITICKLLNDYFFSYSESNNSFGSLTKDSIEKRIKASYDLRSQYVHTGGNFGSWLAPNNADQWEFHSGTPVGLPPKLTRLIVETPTYIGMERIMRYCLLRFIHLYSGNLIDSRLD